MEKREIFKARCIKHNEEDKFIVTVGEIMFYRGENPELYIYDNWDEADEIAQNLNSQYDWDVICPVIMAIIKGGNK